MKKPFVVYYVSRALLSAGFSILVFGLTWKALVLAAVLFTLFLLYLHSGWFVTDPSNPLFPIRRDGRAREAQRRALIAAIVTAASVLLVVSIVAPAASVAAAPLAIPLALLAYFASQFYFLART